MLILASQSPRRADLLQQIGVPFTQCPVDIDETVAVGENPATYVQRMASEKSAKGWQLNTNNDVVLGADTIVVAKDIILGKPKDKDNFAEMMGLLSANTHNVLTSVAMTSAVRQKTILIETQVSFGPLTNQQIQWYWQTGEPHDKAGGYGIQGLGGQFVESIVGSYSAVVGLPLYQTRILLTEFGLINEC